MSFITFLDKSTRCLQSPKPKTKLMLVVTKESETPAETKGKAKINDFQMLLSTKTH